MKIAVIGTGMVGRALADTMIDPARIPGEHHLFLAGDDDRSKATVLGLLADLGWPGDTVLDLGGIKAARGVEMYSRLFFTLADNFGDFDFNIAVVRAK